jgi:FemAB-related protein (PEP-CTERM system-associated)
MFDGVTAPLEVRRLEDKDIALWDEFVLAAPDATFFHRAGWKRVIERSFGHRCYFLYACAGGRVRGVLPLVHIKSRLFGKALISNAFCVYGGPVAQDGEASAALDAEAIALARSLGVDYLEYRRLAPGNSDWAQEDQLYVTFRKELDPDPGKNLAVVPRKQRAMVRKGINFGLRGEVDPGVDRFYRLYSESVRNLGTPVFAKGYFRELRDVFGADCEVLTVTHDGAPISSVMSFYFRDEVLPYYGGGSKAARALAANDFMYWEVMRRACEAGCRVFDFGRSKRGSGSFSFKKHWGMKPQPLYHEYKLLRRADLPAINPTNPKYRLFIAMWRRLPLALANSIGPYVARDLG